MTHQTTAEHFAIFKEECQRNIEQFGLLDWCVDFAHKRLADDERALCCFHNAGKVVTITLSTEWDETYEPNDYVVRRAAFHEACELLLAEAHSVALNHSELTITQRYNAISTALHAVIRRLENRWGHKENVLKWDTHRDTGSLRFSTYVGGTLRIFSAREAAIVGAFGRAYVIFSRAEEPGRFIAAMLPALRDDLATSDKLYLGECCDLQDAKILCERDLQSRLEDPLNRHIGKLGSIENVWYEP